MSRQKRKPTISALEPRILFDGAAVATGVEVLDNSSFDSNNDSIEDTPPATQTPKDRIEIAFVDSNLPDYQNLVDGISSDIQVYIVDSNVNGLDFMADVLSTMQDVDALHILGHGSEGSITLGTATLNKDNLSQYNDILSSLGDSLDENGDILLYGCSVSSGENGVSFIQNLSEITKADISASTNATGLGGDWELESSTGIIETESLSFPTYAGDMGIPSISGLGDVTFTEDGSAVNPGSNISITNGSSYDGKYIEYSLTNGSSSDQLTLTSDANVNASGAISVDGNNVYLGNGSGKDVIGSIDSTYNGQNGQKLRINFVSSFSNASFETGTITGWTAMNQMINLGSTVIAGWTSQDTSDYSNNANSGGNDNDVPSGSYSTSVVSESGNNTDGSYALKLTSSMTTANGYDVVHGPAVYSSEFQASSGDIIYFDWRAYAGGDDFDAFGYIVNVNTGAQIEVLDATGGSNTAWTTKATTISTSGTYRFVFVNGTYDASGGRVAGGQLYIDNVRVYGNKVNDAVVTSISKLIAFSNTSEAPTTTARTFNVTAVDSNGNSGSASSTINVTSVNDLPYITGVETATVNEDTSITISGITVSDVDSVNLTVTISANNGNLSLGSSSGLSVTGSGTHDLVITGSSANLNTALATLRYQGDANWFGSDPLTITVNDNDGSGEQPYRINQTGKFFNTENGHYYEFVSASGITWDQAKTDAEARTLYGLNGYLVTITSATENALMMSMAGGNGWIGASDANSEGIWKWVTGPESGTQFWTGDTNAGTNSTSNYGSAYNGQYANWASGEPNNSDGSRGGEDVAHFYYSGANAGTWNDFAATNTSSIAGYIVEYGGTTGTLTAANLTITVVSVNDLPVNSVPTARTTNEDTAIVFSSGNSNAITIGDNDSLNDPSIVLTTTISIGNGKGTLTATTGSGATINGNSTTTVQIIGTVTQINAALEGLTYAPTADANGSAYTTLTIATNDGTTTDTDTVTINITAVDDKPVANAMAATVGPNSKQSFDQFMPNFSDVDNDIMTEAYQLEILSLPTVGGFQVYDGSGDKADDANWVNISSLASLTVASGYTLQDGRLVISMADLSNYRFDAGNNSGLSTNVNWRVMTAGDTSDSTGWSNSATGVVTILNTASNDAPDVNIYNGSIAPENLLNSGSITINEDSSQANIILLFNDDYTPEEYIQGIISSSNTDLIDMSCISYTRSTTNNTGDTVTFTFTPKANKYGTTTITLGANDGDKSATQSFTLNVTSINEQAIVDNFTKVIDEDNSFSFATINPTDIYHDSNDVNANTGVSAVDYNAQMAIIQDAMMNPSDTDKQTAKAIAVQDLINANYFPQSFIIDTLPTNGDLYLGNTQITATGYTVAIADLETLSYHPDANYYGTDSFTWHALDKEGLATTIKTATFTINAVNDAPVATALNTIEITDTSGASISGTISSTLTATDVDNASLTYSIVDNSSDVTSVTGNYGTLTIDSSTGDYTYVPNLTAITALNTNTTETFSLKVSDGLLDDTVTLTINITATAETSSTYNEQDSATLIMTDTSIDTNESYGGGYVEFEIGSATATEILSLQKVATADITDGAVSIVGNAVYLGDGTSVSAIGQIDGIYNGQNGQKLRINFAVDFTNGNFNSSNSSVGLLSSTTNAMINIDGWTIVNGRVNLGVDTIAGLATPEDTTNPARTISATDKDGNNLVRGTFYTYINDDDGNSGNDNSIKMNSSLTSASGYAIVRGPYIYSDSAVSLKVGDTVSFDWKAQGGGDAYDVFGYIIDVNNPSNYQIILNETGANARATTAWDTESITVATDGDYKFVFVSGSWDATGGRALGAQLYIDDVKVTQANPTSNLTSDVLEKIAQKVTYQNTSDLTANNSNINRTVTVTASSGDSTPITHSSTKTITINEINDPVTLSAPSTIYYTDTDGTDVFTSTSGQLSATDADSNTTYTYGIDGGTVSGSTVTQIGTYGTLTLNLTTGAYTYAPDSNAINALSSNVTEQFTLNVSDGSGSTDSQILTISIDSVNDAPLLGGTTATQTYVENGTAVQVDPNITITDLEGTSYDGGYISFSITANKESIDNLSVLSLGGVTLSGLNVNYGGQTIGTIDSTYNGQNGNDLRINLNANAYSLDVQALARAVGFSNPSDNFSTEARAIEIKVNDGGDGNSTTARYSTKTVNVNLQAINDLPTSNLGTSSFIVEKVISTNPNGTLALGSIISFADLDDTQLTVKLETTNYGSLYLRDDVTNGVDSSQIIGNNSRSITITGTIEEINATLAASDGIIYTAGYGNDFVTPGADYLKVTAIDSSLQEAVSQKMIIVLPAVPNAYSDNVVGNEDGNIVIDIDTLISDINENTGTYIFGTGTPDITNSNGDITTAGSITIFDNSKLIYADYDIDGDGDIDNDDTSKPIGYQLTHGKLILNNDTNLTDDANFAQFTFIPDENWYGVESFLYQYNSGDGEISNIAQISIFVTPVNDAPVITVNSTASIDEDGNFIFSNVDLISLSDVDFTGDEEFSITLNVQNGILQLSGLDNLTLLEGVDNSSYIKLRGNLTDIQNAINGLKYLSNENYNGNDSLSITISDLGNIGEGNVLESTSSISISINAVNDAPYFMNQTDYVDENASVSGVLPISDIDSPSYTVSIANGSVAPTGFTITANGHYTFDASSYNSIGEGETQRVSVEITADDGDTNGQTTRTLEFVIEGKNDAPFVKDGVNLNQRIAFGEAYNKDLSVIFDDLDVTDTHTYEIIGLPKGLQYDPNTGMIRGKAEGIGKFNVVVKATDSSGTTVEYTYEMEVIAPPQTPIAQQLVREPTRETKSQDYDNTGLGLQGNGSNNNENSGIDGLDSLGTNENQSPLGQNNNSIVEGVKTFNINVGNDGQVVFNDNQNGMDSDNFGIESVNIENKFIAITISGEDNQTYNATLADGSPLPNGFVIDSKTGTITGILPEGVEELDIIIKASGKDGVKTINVKINVKDMKGNQQLVPLKEQVSAEIEKHESYGTNLLFTLSKLTA
ncbi:MAG: DUF4347 domain-containing protein [Arcobacteraceae bacterium]|nr:DUF4347 domain-containing protein [Arcobacteraceae bacterium]